MSSTNEWSIIRKRAERRPVWLKASLGVGVWWTLSCPQGHDHGWYTSHSDGYSGAVHCLACKRDYHLELPCGRDAAGHSAKSIRLSKRSEEPHTKGPDTKEAWSITAKHHPVVRLTEDGSGKAGTGWELTCPKGHTLRAVTEFDTLRHPINIHCGDCKSDYLVNL